MTCTNPQRNPYTTEHFLRGIRIAVSLITSIVLAALILAHHDLRVYGHLGWVQVACFAVLLIILARELLLIHRRAAWGMSRWPAAAAALAAGAVSAACIPTSSLMSSADWAFGTVGWAGAILLLDQPLRFLVMFVAVHHAITVANLLVSGQGSGEMLLNLLGGSLDSAGFPLAVGIAATLLRKVAATAQDAYQETAKIQRSDALAKRLHQWRQDRYDALSTSVIPLLAGLADGSLDPSATETQRACAIEASRMRRLFAESDRVPDRLLHELRASIEVAERRGVLVELETRGQWQDPPLRIRRALLEGAVLALAHAISRARVCVMHAGGTLAVNVVCDTAVTELPVGTEPGVDVTVATEGQRLWVETQWTA